MVCISLNVILMKVQVAGQLHLATVDLNMSCADICAVNSDQIRNAEQINGQLAFLLIHP